MGGDGGQPDAGQLREHGLDLAELDAVTADLHLGVRPAEVDQAVRLGPDQVASVVGPLRAQRREWPEGDRVPLGIEVAGHSGPADHQLADLSPGDRLPAHGVSHGQPPPVKRQPDAHRLAGRQRAAEDTTVASVGP